MTPDQFRTIRTKLGLSQGQLAPLIGLNSHGNHRVSDFENGRVAIPWHTGQLMLCYEKLGVKAIPRTSV